MEQDIRVETGASIDLRSRVFLALAAGGYRLAEARAQSNEIGLWSGTFERPGDWREARRGDLAASRSPWSLHIAWMRLKRLTKPVLRL